MSEIDLLADPVEGHFFVLENLIRVSFLDLFSRKKDIPS